MIIKLLINSQTGLGHSILAGYSPNTNNCYTFDPQKCNNRNSTVRSIEDFSKYLKKKFYRGVYMIDIEEDMGKSGGTKRHNKSRKTKRRKTKKHNKRRKTKRRVGGVITNKNNFAEFIFNFVKDKDRNNQLTDSEKNKLYETNDSLDEWYNSTNDVAY